MYVVKPYLIAVVEEREFYRRRNITDVSVNVGLTSLRSLFSRYTHGKLAEQI